MHDLIALLASKLITFKQNKQFHSSASFDEPFTHVQNRFTAAVAVAAAAAVSAFTKQIDSIGQFHSSNGEPEHI